MFRELTRAHHRSDRGLFGRRHRFVLTDAVTRSVGEREFERMHVEQGYHPVLLAADGETYWWYSNRYYRGDPGMTADAVRTRAFEAHMRRREQVERADGIPRTAPDVLLAVWDRDGGRCAECGGSDRLSFGRGGGNGGLRVVCDGCAVDRDEGESTSPVPFLPLPTDA